MNPDIANLIDENTLGEAAHNMFSGALERKMKERAESIKLLSASKCSCPYKLITTSVLSGRLTHCPPPERWWPSKQREILAEACQEVTSCKDEPQVRY